MRVPYHEYFDTVLGEFYSIRHVFSLATEN